MKTPARRPRDADATQRRILRAATAEFATKGLAGARVDEIAARANVNKRMIYVYFESKDGLFLAVLEKAYGHIRGAERKLDLVRLDPKQAITTLVDFTWSYYLKNPGFLRLINSENLHKAVHLKRSKLIREVHTPFVEMVCDVIDRGVKAGLFRDKIDPIQLNISIAALGYYYLTNTYTSSVIFGTDLSDPEALKRRRDVILDTILRYVLARPDD